MRHKGHHHNIEISGIPPCELVAFLYSTSNGKYLEKKGNQITSSGNHVTLFSSRISRAVEKGKKKEIHRLKKGSPISAILMRFREYQTIVPSSTVVIGFTTCKSSFFIMDTPLLGYRNIQNIYSRTCLVTCTTFKSNSRIKPKQHYRNNRISDVRLTMMFGKPSGVNFKDLQKWKVFGPQNVWTSDIFHPYVIYCSSRIQLSKRKGKHDREVIEEYPLSARSHGPHIERIISCHDSWKPIKIWTTSQIEILAIPSDVFHLMYDIDNVLGIITFTCDIVVASGSVICIYFLWKQDPQDLSVPLVFQVIEFIFVLDTEQNLLEEHHKT
ncbi:hypothetical protein YC2023_007004 [Brassica napus]